MALNLIKHTWQKVVLVSFVSLVALVLLAALFINMYWSPILEGKVKTAVAEGTDSLYKIDFAHADLHILKGEIVIYDIHFRPDTLVYNRQKVQKTAPNILTELRVKRLVLSHIHPFKLYFKKILDFDQIILSAPQVRVSYQKNQVKDTTIVPRTPWQKLSKTLKSAHVGRILLNDIRFRYDDYSGKKLATSHLKDMDVRAEDLLIDSTTQIDTSRLFYCRDIITNLRNYKGRTPDGSYTYTVNLVKLSTRTSRLNVEGIDINPDKNYYAKSRKDRYNIHLDSLQLNNFDYLSYHKYRSFSGSSLLFANGTVDIFKNPNKRKIYKDKIKSYPHVALYNAGFDLKIDTIVIKRLNIIYGELGKKSGRSGAIRFMNTNGQLLNITTNKIALQKNNISTADITTYFMNRGKLDVHFTFNLTDEIASFSYKGKLNAMNLRDINAATVPLAMVKITSGKLKEFTFNIKGNRKGTSGRVQLLYNDLKVKLLKADTVQKTLKRKTIASLFANVFIVKDNNPDNPGDVPRAANVVFKRPIDSPFWGTVWKTLLAGIKINAGMDEKAKQVTAALTKKSLDTKLDRKARKALRQKKRAERKRLRQLKSEQKAAEEAKEKAAKKAAEEAKEKQDKEKKE
jgi:hypothetical protein